MTKHITKVHRRKFFFFPSGHSELQCAWVFECAICLIELSTIPEMNDHFSSDHKIEKLDGCEICSTYFKDKNILSTHIKSYHEGRNLHQCSICLAKFGSEQGMDAHKELHQKFKAFPISSDFAAMYGFNVDNLAQEEENLEDIVKTEILEESNSEETSACNDEIIKGPVGKSNF